MINARQNVWNESLAIFKSLVPEIELLETGGTAGGNFEIRGSDIFLVQKYPRRIEIVSIIVVK